MRRPFGVGLWLCLPFLAGVYLPFIGGGLLTDDFAHVVHLSNIDGAARLIDQPDTFGFYRPVTQASMVVAPGANGDRPSQARALNIALHAGVIALAFIVARLSLRSPIAAGLATLAFALTPKAAPIAVLWISARGELLMALFSFAAIASWIVWTRAGRSWWLATAALGYALAILSKETAALLPLLLLVTPRPERTLTSRAAAVLGMVGVAALVIASRTQIGALTPFSGDEHYTLLAPVARVLANALNYGARMLAAPLALVAVFGVARLSLFRTVESVEAPRATATDDSTTPLVFAAAFVVAFLAPVLPIPLRGELYLYLPVFGPCLLAGRAAAALVHRVMSRRAVFVAIALYVIALGGYQMARGYAIHQDLVFSEKLVAALRSSSHLAGREGLMVLVPSDARTEAFLQRAVGGYLFLAVYHVLGHVRLLGNVEYGGDRIITPALRLACSYDQDARVIISPAP
jgi:hypothetical protein